MLYEILFPLHERFTLLNVFRYITFRSFGAAITALILCLWLGPFFIRKLKSRQIGQEVRDDGPQTHLSKKGTPTMGGLFLLFSALISTLLWADWNNLWIWVSLLSMVGFGFIGFLDDYLKVIRKNPKGLIPRYKFGLQLLIGTAVAFLIYWYREVPPVLKFPFFKDFALDLGPWMIPFAVLVIVGASNAVNLTDGLDGLAAGSLVVATGTFLILAYCTGHILIAEYLQLTYVPGVGELSVFLAAVAASCLGFLWFNTYPAQVFMGDVGALSLGACLGTVAVMTKNEILLAVCGGVFVLEALSVIAQVTSYKLTQKRVFRMAPLHHHFELKGWPEPKVIVRFWILSILLALVTLATLKLR